ncbi:hypothetical protein FD754_015669 [Muntiacus muntjak]|uniref:Ig-like domain-containing protein n=1 Tax=Muntiacus muntjak TaxID=9888 RepID=A0A5N3VNP3_MUNMU|nr:hypothetical protein FD754_015669 [Muntiacus muntjak]
MAPGPSTLLGLALAQTEVMGRFGTLPRPSISAEPGSVVPWGRPVSIVCRGPAGVRSFLLEKDDRHNYKVLGVTSRGEQETEAKFRITALREDAVGRYRCIYETESGWSQRSEALNTTSVRNSVKEKCVCVYLQRYIYLHRLLLPPVQAQGAPRPRPLSQARAGTACLPASPPCLVLLATPPCGAQGTLLGVMGQPGWDGASGRMDVLLCPGLLQARILQRVAMPSSRGSSPPSDRTRVS